ncbi:MAG: hypothetical protein HAW60_05240 [Bdellovibrionales bacterium]|nr:hypothetical protein [Bdellovibrionales bacterium]
MKIILICTFTFIFYTILTELSSENSFTNSNDIVENQNRVPAKIKNYKPHLVKTNTQKKLKLVDEDIIDEALNSDKGENFSEVQNSLEQALLKSISEKQLSLEESAQYKKHFIREYLRKAKESGFDILLNDQLQVVSIKKRRTYDPILIEEDDDE